MTIQWILDIPKSYNNNLFENNLKPLKYRLNCIIYIFNGNAMLMRVVSISQNKDEVVFFLPENLKHIIELYMLAEK